MKPASNMAAKIITLTRHRLPLALLTIPGRGEVGELAIKYPA